MECFENDHDYIYSEMIYGIYFPYDQVKHLVQNEYSSGVCFFKTETGYNFVGIKLNNTTLEDLQSKVRFDLIDLEIYSLCTQLNIELYIKNIITMHYRDTSCTDKYNTDCSYTLAEMVYGIWYDFDKVQEILNKNDKYLSFFSKVKVKLKPDDFGDVFLWDESLYDRNDVTFITLCEVGCRSVNPYFDPPSKHQEFYLGVDLTNTEIDYLKNFDTYNVNKKIIDLCEKYNLPYKDKEIKMYYTVDVC